MEKERGKKEKKLDTGRTNIGSLKQLCKTTIWAIDIIYSPLVIVLLTPSPGFEAVHVLGIKVSAHVNPISSPLGDPWQNSDEPEIMVSDKG